MPIVSIDALRIKAYPPKNVTLPVPWQRANRAESPVSIYEMFSLLWTQPIHQTREWYRLSHMVKPTDPSYSPLDTKTKAGMGKTAIFA